MNKVAELKRLNISAGLFFGHYGAKCSVERSRDDSVNIVGDLIYRTDG